MKIPSYRPPYRPPRHGIFGVIASTPVHMARNVTELSRHWFTGEVITLKTLRGEITVTHNQPLRVPDGWLRAAHLSASSDLLFEMRVDKPFNTIDKVWTVATLHGTAEPLPHDELDLEYLPLNAPVNFMGNGLDSRLTALPIVEMVRSLHSGFVYSAATSDGWLVAGGLVIAGAESLANYAEHHGQFH